MAVAIKSFKRVVPMIYAYTTPGVSYHEGWTKVGYTEKQTVEKRIAQQTHTAGIRYKMAWQDNAMYKDGSGDYFTDHDFHAYLEQNNIKREQGTEWFQEDADTLRKLFDQFTRRELIAPLDICEYTLRKEQEDAVAMTKAYFEQGGQEFLWNAKPRFGKTLTAYDLVRQMHFTKVLIVTNRPSIANSWADDFNKFIAWRGDLAFVSDTDALADKAGVVGREAYKKAMLAAEEDEEKGMVAFESLQGLKGSIYFGGEHNKLKWMSELDFDLLIIDEAQEGVDTLRTERAFDNIKRKYTLYLSGTPFKALASEQFSKEQIYNWSYADEQEAKENWQGEDYNPYEKLPRLEMYTYQLSQMITDKIEQGANLTEDESVDYTFDLNEFFATNDSGKFIHEADVKKFLHALTVNEKYPYSTPLLREELPHTLWLLNRVASAKALARLLKNDSVFGEYEVVLAAGDGQLENEKDCEKENEKAFARVKKAITENDKTITLSVGQLTVGVTIPEWSGVMMLCNLSSPSSYMQAAFRAQNPCEVTRNGQRVRKETAYVFDFDPSRTLIIFDEFANNLSAKTAAGKGTAEDRAQNIKKLLNFFPVLGEDSEGRMVELDAAQVLSIPRKLKSQEVVRKGFMCNFLFQNISNIFAAPSVVKDIVGKLSPSKEQSKKKHEESLNNIVNVKVDEEGQAIADNEIVIGKKNDLFGPKYYETVSENFEISLSKVAESSETLALQKAADEVTDTLVDIVKTNMVPAIATGYGLKKAAAEREAKKTEKEIETSIGEIKKDFAQREKIAKVEYDKKVEEAKSEEEKAEAKTVFNANLQEAMQKFSEAVQEIAEKTLKEKPQEIIERVEQRQANNEKKTIEDTVRAHLRGFSRTIPSFIMAYGDENLTLQNIDDYTEDDVFEEVTGISEKDFRFLRDGGTYIDEATGEEAVFEGHLFDETVFNDSIKEFLKKRQELANYFDETHTEDIFDYIPPQKTNQIFTPRWVVSKMVDMLEENNSGCFDDATNTFADLYMKSGLYITEIVKRLFRSEAMKTQIPDDEARIHHILTKQVYGMAPTRIIYLIATNYILGFDEHLKLETTNFVQADAAEAAKEGKLEQLVDEKFA